MKQSSPASSSATSSSATSERGSTTKDVVLSFRTISGVLALPASDIILCKALGKNTLLRYRTGADGTTETIVFHLLADIEERCHERSASMLVRCHRSTVVNMAYCRGWQQTAGGLAVQMCEKVCKEPVTVSRRRSKAFLAAFMHTYPVVK